MKKIYFIPMIIAAAATVFAACKKDPEPEPVAPPSLTVAPPTISAANTAGTHPVTVTSNVSWTAAVSSGAAWCTVSPATATGNGTVTVSVTANPTVEARTATVTVAAGTLTKTVAVTQAAGDATLTADKTELPATAAAGSYTIGVTSNTAWTASVNSAATAWVTLTSASATGNGTVTVTVSANTAATSRSATVTLTSGTLSRTVTVAQAAVPTPSLAASTRTWGFGGNLFWSDVIQVSACNKEDFFNSASSGSCRSYVSGGITSYYYNWAYVDNNKYSLCPTPWRVPTKADFDVLVASATLAILVQEWGLRGVISPSTNAISGYTTDGFNWSSTDGGESTIAAGLRYTNSVLEANNYGRNNGGQVRCVR